MKKKILIFSIILSLLCCFTNAEEMVVTTDKSPVQKSANSSQVVDFLNNGEKFEKAGESGEFYGIKYGENVYYISKKYVNSLTNSTSSTSSTNTTSTSTTLSNNSNKENSRMEKKTLYSSQGKAIVNYWLYTPEIVTEDMPVIVILHGRDENGYALETLANSIMYCKNLKNHKIGCEAVVIMPVTPKGSFAVNLVNNNGAVYKILDEIDNGKISVNGKTLSISKDKRALIGFSDGGAAAWHVTSILPDKFKVVVPISGADSLNYGNAAKVNYIYALCGGSGSLEASRASIMKSLVKNINNKGGNAEFKSYPKATHGSIASGTIMYELFKNSDLLNWVVEHLYM